MPQYDSSFIDMLTSRADIVDLASRHTRLTRKGGRYWGCCPFHNEKTPSFTVVRQAAVLLLRLRQGRQRYRFRDGEREV